MATDKCNYPSVNPLLRLRAASHCIMAWRFCLTNTCFALLPNVYSSMVPGNLPSQLEILSTGQNYYESPFQPGRATSDDRSHKRAFRSNHNTCRTSCLRRSAVATRDTDNSALPLWVRSYAGFRGCRDQHPDTAEAAQNRKSVL